MQEVEKKLKQQIKVFILPIGSFFILFPLCYIFLQYLYFNPSISEPIGYYLVYGSSDYKAGDKVLLCVNDTISIKLMHKFGLPYEKAACLMDTPYLLKTIVGIAGDEINITSKGIYVNNKLINNSIPLDETRGIRLNPMPSQVFKLRVNQYFVMGNTIHSYDSRYFGVVEQDQIKFKARLIWTTKNL